MYFPELPEYIKGVDLLYHEATYPSEMQEKAVKRYHSTTLEAARQALDAGVGKLLIGHFSSKYPDLQIFLDEAQTVFKNTEIAKELQEYELKA